MLRVAEDGVELGPVSERRRLTCELAGLPEIVGVDEDKQAACARPTPLFSAVATPAWGSDTTRAGGPLGYGDFPKDHFGSPRGES